MATFQVELSLAAMTDLQGITDQLATVNPAAAARLFHSIKMRCLSLDEFPERGLSIAFQGTTIRHIFEGHFIIRYRVLDNTVQILRIGDGRKNPAGLWDGDT